MRPTGADDNRRQRATITGPRPFPLTAGPGAWGQVRGHVGAIEQTSESLRRVVLWDVVDVAHRGLNVGVPHPRLYVGERERLHGEGPE